MNQLLEQLHDIEGVDPISWWPLAIGWWFVLAIALVIVGASVCFAIYRWSYNRSWKKDTLTKLARLEENLSEATARESIVLLSEYLRRIALKRFSRKECAGLKGAAWLKWLHQQDPKQFNWETRGALLIEIPYAPVNYRLSDPATTNEIKEWIRATKEWVV